MTPEAYTKFTRTTRCKMPVTDEMMIPILALGLAGEAGEVCDKIKKLLRAGEAIHSINVGEIEKELGDVLWYLTSIADELGLTLEDVMSTNVEKIKGRLERATLYGAGDNR